MKATLTELHRETSKLIRPVIHGGQKLTLTDRGEDCAEIIPKQRVDRQGLIAALRAMGPVELPIPPR